MEAISNVDDFILKLSFTNNIYDIIFANFNNNSQNLVSDLMEFCDIYFWYDRCLNDSNLNENLYSILIFYYFNFSQDLVIHEDAPQTTEDDTGEQANSQVTNLPTLTETAKLALIAHTISAYAVALPRSHAQRLAGRLAADTTRWLSHIFRFMDCASSFHEDHLEGLVRVTRLALHRKYPRYMEEGFTALSSSSPLIYSSVAAPLAVVQHLCRQVHTFWYYLTI